MLNYSPMFENVSQKASFVKETANFGNGKTGCSKQIKERGETKLTIEDSSTRAYLALAFRGAQKRDL